MPNELIQEPVKKEEKKTPEKKDEEKWLTKTHEAVVSRLWNDTLWVKREMPECYKWLKENIKGNDKTENWAEVLYKLNKGDKKEYSKENLLKTLEALTGAQKIFAQQDSIKKAVVDTEKEVMAKEATKKAVPVVVKPPVAATQKQAGLTDTQTTFANMVDDFVEELNKTEKTRKYVSPEKMEWLWGVYNHFIDGKGKLKKEVDENELNDRLGELIEFARKNPGATRDEFDWKAGALWTPKEEKKEEEPETAEGKKAPARKATGFSAAQLDKAEKTGKELYEAFMKRDAETLERLLPKISKGYKWFGGTGKNVDLGIAVLQAFYNASQKEESDKIAVDGIYGKQTFAAMKVIQEGVDAKVDGYYDGKTRDAILAGKGGLKKEETKKPATVAKKGEIFTKINAKDREEAEAAERAKERGPTSAAADKRISSTFALQAALQDAGLTADQSYRITLMAEKGTADQLKTEIEKAAKVTKIVQKPVGGIRSDTTTEKTVEDETATIRKERALLAAVKKIADGGNELAMTVSDQVSLMLGEEAKYAKKKDKEKEPATAGTAEPTGTTALKSEEKKVKKEPTDKVKNAGVLGAGKKATDMVTNEKTSSKKALEGIVTPGEAERFEAETKAKDAARTKEMQERKKAKGNAPPE